MTDNVDDLLLEHLKPLRNEVAGMRGEMRREFKNVKQRLSSMEVTLIELRRDDLHTDSNVARQQVTIDELLERIQRIETRLDMS